MLRLRMRFRLSGLFVLALLMALTGANQALAYHPLSNLEFGAAPGCNLAGWNVFTTAGGSVTANTEAAYGLSPAPNCVAELESHSTGLVERSILKQEFHPPLAGPIWLNLDFLLRTAGGPPAAAQVIEVYDLDRPGVICRNTFNTNSIGFDGYSCDISSGAGHHLEIRFIARADSAAGYPDVRLYADHLQISNMPRCGAPAGPGSAQICP